MISSLDFNLNVCTSACPIIDYTQACEKIKQNGKLIYLRNVQLKFKFLLKPH